MIIRIRSLQPSQYLSFEIRIHVFNSNNRTDYNITKNHFVPIRFLFLFTNMDACHFTDHALK